MIETSVTGTVCALDTRCRVLKRELGVSMASRLVTWTERLVSALPLVVGLAIGTWLATATLSWGNAFIIWQFLWWSIVSVVIGLFTVRAARMIPPAIPSKSSSDEDKNRLEGIILLSYAGG